MHIIRRKTWDVIERPVSPEHVVLNRRSLVAGATALSILPMASGRAEVPVNQAFKPGRASHRRKIRNNLQQLL